MRFSFHAFACFCYILTVPTMRDYSREASYDSLMADMDMLKATHASTGFTTPYIADRSRASSHFEDRPFSRQSVTSRTGARSAASTYMMGDNQKPSRSIEKPVVTKMIRCAQVHCKLNIIINIIINN